ncbi:MAG: serine/threonine protein phosphatase [Deltaproteobacteria bacterium]|nr:serine/threonine protein phosphatase [Deltaproteobacteria bacterium]
MGSSSRQAGREPSEEPTIPQKRRYTLNLSSEKKKDSLLTHSGYDPTIALIASASDIGRVRTINQDECGDFQHPESGVRLLLVADGMGGHRGGEVASQMAVRRMGEVFQEDSTVEPSRLLEHAFNEANQVIFERSSNESELAGMGTTAVALLLDGSPAATLAHVGDSRAYRMREGQLEQLTADHSVVGELVKRGQLSLEEARHHPQSNEILRALGTRNEVQIELTPIDIMRGDRFLLCSDGLSGMLSEPQISEILSEGHPQEIAEKLIEEANQAGGMDNVTVQVVVLPRPKSEDGITRAPSDGKNPGAAAAGPWLRWAITLILLAGILALLLLGLEDPANSP